MTAEILPFREKALQKPKTPFLERRQTPLLRILPAPENQPAPQVQKEIPWQELTHQHHHPSHLISPKDHGTEALIVAVEIRTYDKVATLMLNPIAPDTAWTRDIDTRTHKLVEVPSRIKNQRSNRVQIIQKLTNEIIKIIDLRDPID